MNILQSIWHGVEFVTAQIVAVVGVNLALEEPPYILLDRISDTVEIRQYSNRIVAETTIDLSGGDSPAMTDEEASSQGFRRIAGYIFGANISKQSQGESSQEIPMTAPVEINNESIAMTAPVEISASKTMTMRFVMPSQYRLETLPTPNDKRVILKEIPGETLAVLSYSGRRKFETITEKASELTDALSTSQWRLGPSAQLRQFYYNPPWTLPFFRRNEVAFEVVAKP
ncbi:MAG: heme-binding protein [Candidatus Pacebacteria bacterium]|nr:heme-binding protein [Candidatus Paceibacterota bacterium]